ncbi:MAG: hypothetical protein M3383_01975 [Actinomycetota bacterium]|nr:hypothetical protein [Actinomycetota bacterium]
MRPKLALIFALAAFLVTVPVVGCGEKEGEEAREAVEGEPLHLGGLIYNVAITRFLNPADVEDSAYLAGQQPPPVDQSYLGVFLTISNEEDEEIGSATGYAVTDSTEREYEPLETASAHALEIGVPVPADDQIPAADTTASQSAIQGSLLLFLVADDVSAARPLELQIEGPEESGHIELDI